ncbi:MAG: metal-binding protein [Hyphomicrobiales bacterium]|nr:MAG: metal-binding protein [Hyphomicrobiales bacterium]
MDPEGYSHLGAADRGLAWFARRPKLIVTLLVVLTAGIGWAYLTIMVAVMVPDMDMAALGPGMGIFNAFNNFQGLDAAARAALVALCSPGTAASFGMPATGSWGIIDLTLVFLMWVMMAFAMMLPTAAPMLATYADLAQKARAKGEEAAPVVVLGLGYLSVWSVFGVVATFAQWGLTELRVMTPMMAPASLVLAGTTLMAAGIYQFTPAKNACLTRCQTPLPFFYTNWRGDFPGVFRLGVDQGLLCFGCCWALMTVMFAVGVMNIVWIAVLGVLMSIEKMVINPWIPRAIGVTFLVWGAAVLLMAEPIRRAIGL